MRGRARGIGPGGGPRPAAAALAAAALALGLSDAATPEAPPPGARTAAAATGPAQLADLGQAEYPRGCAADPVDHLWTLPHLRPPRYHLGYKLDGAHAIRLAEGLLAYARNNGHRKIDATRFLWTPPRECGTDLRCVYRHLDREGSAGVTPIARLFRRRAAESRLSSLDLAELVIGFIQGIPYRSVDDLPFDVLPPPLVVREKRGDCDSKALLAHMILRELGIRTVLISSVAHRHTMLGVALPAPGESFTYGGTRYAYVEMTRENWRMGQVAPQLLRPNDWRVVPLAAAAPAPAGERGGEAPRAVAPPGGGRIRRR